MSITAVTTDANGKLLGGDRGSFSPDGSTILFDSNAFYFGYQDPNTYQNEVYEKNLTTGVVTRLSNSRYGGPADGNNVHAAFSPDGTAVAFSSSSTYIPGSGPHTAYDNGDLFVVANGTTRRVSTSYDGSALDGSSGSPAFSPDGTQVAYISYATDLVPNDTNQIPDIFLTNLATLKTTRLSTDASGAQATGSSGISAPVFTPDGQNVIFASAAPNLVANDTDGTADIFEKNIPTGAVTRLSVAQDGTEGNGDSENPTVSADGTKVAFDSSSTDFAANDTNNSTDVFVKNLVTGTLTRVSTAADGTQANGNSSNPVFSPDGTKIAFVSYATNLTSLHQANFHGNIFVKDLVTGIVSQISVAYDGSEVNGDSSAPQFSPDGTKILFTSAATNIVPNDTDGLPDIFVADVPVCFAAGTHIRTRSGDVLVERLAAGDLVATASGAHRPIRWLGHRRVACRRHPRPEAAMPVRIAAHALGENRPARDLLVSPGHAICVDVLGEVLVPAAALVNGASIAQVEVDAVTYWHVELDSHDVLLAENLACESYLDMGNRGFFAEADVVDLGAGPDGPDAGDGVGPTPRTHADFCRPYVAGGPLVAALRAQSRRRAATLGWHLEAADAGSLHLVVDGQRIDPDLSGLSARFVVPAAAQAAWLCSDAARPCDVLGTDDARRLGLWLAGLSIETGDRRRRDIAVHDARLNVGFHTVEAGGRWTNGRALLPADLWAGASDGFVLRLDLAGPALPRWVAPRDAAAVLPKPALVA